MSAGCESHLSSSTPHRRHHSNDSSQAYARRLQAEAYLAGLQQASGGGLQSMATSMQGLQRAGLSEQGLQRTALSEQELQQSLAGQSLQQAALVQQGLNQSTLAGLSQNALSGHSHMHSFSPHTPIPQHAPMSWDTTGPSPMIADDHLFTHRPQTASHHHMLQSRDLLPTGEMNQESLPTRGSYLKQDPQAGTGSLQWPHLESDSMSHPAYAPWPAQAPVQPQAGLQTHSHTPAHAAQKPLPQAAFQCGPQAPPQANLPVQAGSGANFATGLLTPPPSRSQSQLQSLADSYVSRHTQGQADALDYLRRSTLIQTLPQTWHSSWPSNTQLPDLEASMEVDVQQPTTQSNSEAAFFSW